MATPRTSYPLDLSFLTWFNLGVDQPSLDAALAALQHDRVVQRIWDRDGSLWGREPEAIRGIEGRCGWLDLPTTMLPHLALLRALSREVREEGITQAVLLGMGGWSWPQR